MAQLRVYGARRASVKRVHTSSNHRRCSRSGRSRPRSRQRARIPQKLNQTKLNLRS